jgi:GT2 family glycosyltransferase
LSGPGGSSGPSGPRIGAVVPTLGKSPWLLACLTALRHQEGASIEIVVVDQGEPPLEVPPALADRVVHPGRNLGFAGGTNAGIAATTAPWIATVNDDAVVEPGWAAALLAAMATTGAAAAQGTNLDLGDPPRIDGRGLSWNRWWQAVQDGHGDREEGSDSEPREVFGVSATAALYARHALDKVSPDGRIFDPLLVSYYEDAELAGRLRQAGYRAVWAPKARARHAGSTTAKTASTARYRWIYGNRYLAAARLLGRDFPAALPKMVLRDLIDLAKSILNLDLTRAAGIVTGWGRAARLRARFAHRGEPVARS